MSLSLNSPGSGRMPPSCFGDHRQRTLRQIAEIVGEIGIDTRDDGLVVVAAVLTERHFAHEEIAHLIDAVLRRHGEGIDDVADRLRHLLAAVEQEAVAEDPLGNLDAGRHQECGPVDGVETHDILAGDVQIGRPVTLEFGALDVGIAGGRDVIRQRIHPDIHHMGRSARHLDAPVERRSRDR